MGISIEDFRAMEARLAKHNPPAPAPADAVADGEEAWLHEEIIAELRRRRWMFIHSRMDRKSTVQKGTPDFAIYPPGRAAFFVECKTKNGKLTEEQTVFKHCAEASDYKFFIIRSFAQFFEILTFLEAADRRTNPASP
ncbi:MAG: hypothetical protein ACLP7I_14095 [Limisphaerales bacterium]